MARDTHKPETSSYWPSALVGQSVGAETASVPHVGESVFSVFERVTGLEAVIEGGKGVEGKVEGQGDA